MAKRRDEESRISQLPKHILHHILSFFSQKEAIQTCVLSKSWRHLGPTRPNVDLCENSIFSYRNNLLFKSVLDKTLQTYQDQKLPLQDLHVEMSSLDYESCSLLEKSVKNMSTFRLAFTGLGHFPLPRVVFRSESLKEIYLSRLELTNQLLDEKKVLFKHLKTLQLWNCYIEDEIFVNIISNCPFIEYLVLVSCNEPSTVKSYELVHNFSFNNHFPHLKSLCLRDLRLSAESFHNLSSDKNFPCLEELELKSCHGFEKFMLSSRSIKRLIISNMPFKGAIDAPNILCFKVSNSDALPPSVSLTTTSNEWKSQIVTDHLNMFTDDDGVSTWLLKINELLKALSQSQISFKPSYAHCSIKINDGHFTGEPAVVEHLDLSNCQHYSFRSYPHILIFFFRICRPRYMSGMWPSVTAETELRCSEELTSCKSKVIIKDRLGIWDPLNFWQQDLEEISSEVWDHNAKEWHHVQLGILSCPTRCALLDKQKIRYRLKWK